MGRPRVRWVKVGGLPGPGKAFAPSSCDEISGALLPPPSRPPEPRGGHCVVHLIRRCHAIQPPYVPRSCCTFLRTFLYPLNVSHEPEGQQARLFPSHRGPATRSARVAPAFPTSARGDGSPQPPLHVARPTHAPCSMGTQSTALPWPPKPARSAQHSPPAHRPPERPWTSIRVCPRLNDRASLRPCVSRKHAYRQSP
eukprot:scaffold42671_cov52-Phaeocystis_antarctica.AAC.1